MTPLKAGIHYSHAPPPPTPTPNPPRVYEAFIILPKPSLASLCMTMTKPLTPAAFPCPYDVMLPFTPLYLAPHHQERVTFCPVCYFLTAMFFFSLLFESLTVLFCSICLLYLMLLLYRTYILFVFIHIFVI